jgi:deoxyribonuclease-2
MYNDQEPGGNSSSSYAHAKGILGWTSSGGFWLIHSMPLFPNPPASGNFSIPDSARIYGQSFLCVSVDAANLNIIASQLQYAKPQIYASHLPATTATYAPNLTALLNGTFITKIAASNVAPITTRGGQAFTSFNKNSKWGKDVYQFLVAPYFKSSLVAETWMRPYEAPYTGTYKVINVANMCLSGTNKSVCWKETNDHSKWAISTTAGRNVVCIGDINKQKSQWTRGGGTLCIINANLWKIFNAMITATDASSSTPIKPATVLPVKPVLEEPIIIKPIVVKPRIRRVRPVQALAVNNVGAALVDADEALAVQGEPSESAAPAPRHPIHTIKQHRHKNGDIHIAVKITV